MHFHKYLWAKPEQMETTYRDDATWMATRTTLTLVQIATCEKCKKAKLKQLK